LRQLAKLITEISTLSYFLSLTKFAAFSSLDGNNKRRECD
jgi:hypothetical protein